MTPASRYVINTSIQIAAAPDAVWRALIDPELSPRWRGARIETDWRPNSSLIIEALIGAKGTRDKGTVLRVEPHAVLAYDFLPRISMLPDVSESYSVVTVTLTANAEGTLVTVSHTVPPSPIRRGKTTSPDGSEVRWEIGPESGARHVEFYWRGTLPILRDLVEGRPNVALDRPADETPD